ncbi:hypothetical protein [Staphylococcus argensis]|nr:hypothetical protein [Staphylococcus argensis]
MLFGKYNLIWLKVEDDNVFMEVVVFGGEEREDEGDMWVKDIVVRWID